MNTRKLVRELQKAKKEKTPRFRETFTFGTGESVLCESKDHFDVLEGLTDALNDGSIKPEDFSIRELFEECIPDGRELAELMNPRYPGPGTRALTEAAGAIAASDFSNISGQIVYTRLMEKLDNEEFAMTRLIPTQSTPYDGEKIAGIDSLGDQAQTVGELQEYPLIGTSENYIETPQTTKRGFIVPVSKEAIFFDRTNRLLDEAGQVGYWLGVNKEKRAIDAVIDENTTVHRYKWRGTSYATYQAATPWINIASANPLVDWTDVDAAQQVLNAITDPGTGEPVVITPTHLICEKAQEAAAWRVANATEIVMHSGGYATSGNLTETRAPNQFRSLFQIVCTRLIGARSGTAGMWWYGTPAKACVYMENWPISVIRQDEGPAMFHRDIVTQFRCSERGQYAVIEPRVLVRTPPS